MELSKEERKRLKREAKAAKELAALETEEATLPDGKITILCVRFGNKYGRDYVERLRNMVARNISVPHEIVCLTDDQHPLEGVRRITMPDQGYAKQWWHKVHMFDPDLPLAGRILYLDLDVVICNPIDKLTTYNVDHFVGIHDFNREFYPHWLYLNSSVMAWTHGTQSHIYAQFKAKPGEAMRLQGDQDWIWKLCKDRMKFWPKEWVMSYKWEIRNRGELVVINGKRQFNSVRNDIVPPQPCCIAVFHGDPNPCAVQDKFVLDNWY